MSKTPLVLLCLWMGHLAWCAELEGPESVHFERNLGLYYISNKDAGNILYGPKDGPYKVFDSSVTSPHGLEIIGGSLYVCDLNTITVLKVASDGSQDMENTPETISIDGAMFLNGLTSNNLATKDASTIWFTDFASGAIHSLDLATREDSIIGYSKIPNGIAYDNEKNRLIIVNWGEDAPIDELDLSTGTLKPLIEDSGLSNLDGVRIGCDGAIYVSSWGSGGIYKYNTKDLNVGVPEHTTISSDLDKPSDIYYDSEANLIISPNYGESTITFHYLNENCGIE
eukprot:GHVN01038407.1.p1 GENE.GHVN01038407.1~~GHVN01038407.1.p1  ORF type:complete len:283 (-),score=4.64 GHVN01038407.1:86-934(-)